MLGRRGLARIDVGDHAEITNLRQIEALGGHALISPQRTQRTQRRREKELSSSLCSLCPLW
jgi:hypothetical protein